MDPPSLTMHCSPEQRDGDGDVTDQAAQRHDNCGRVRALKRDGD